MTCLIYQNKRLACNTWNTKHDFSLVISKKKSSLMTSTDNVGIILSFLFSEIILMLGKR